MSACPQNAAIHSGTNPSRDRSLTHPPSATTFCTTCTYIPSVMGGAHCTATLATVYLQVSGNDCTAHCICVHQRWRACTCLVCLRARHGDPVLLAPETSFGKPARRWYIQTVSSPCVTLGFNYSSFNTPGQCTRYSPTREMATGFGNPVLVQKFQTLRHSVMHSV